MTNGVLVNVPGFWFTLDEPELFPLPPLPPLFPPVFPLPLAKQSVSNFAPDDEYGLSGGHLNIPSVPWSVVLDGNDVPGQ